jgi:hypothetical protein
MTRFWSSDLVGVEVVVAVTNLCTPSREEGEVGMVQFPSLQAETALLVGTAYGKDGHMV